MTEFGTMTFFGKCAALLLCLLLHACNGLSSDESIDAKLRRATEALEEENRALQRELVRTLAEHRRKLQREVDVARRIRDATPARTAVEAEVDHTGDATTFTSSSRALRKIPFFSGIDYTNGPLRVYYVPNILNQTESAQLIEMATPHFEPSQVFGYTEEASDGVSRSIRSSYTAYLADESVPLVASTVYRAHEIASMPTQNGEDLQVTRYPPGANYSAHFDSSVTVGRLATVLMFLNDVDGGGHTIFPKARMLPEGVVKLRMLREGQIEDLIAHNGRVPPSMRPGVWESWFSALSDLTLPAVEGPSSSFDIGPYCESEAILRFAPKAGDGLLWFNHDMELALDENTMHAGCPPTRGEKYIAQRWMRWYSKESGNEFVDMLRQCGIQPDSNLT